MTAAILVTTAASLPVFLVAASSVVMRSDIGFTERQLGLAVSAYFVAAACVSVPAGRFAEHRGARAGLAVGATVVAVSLVMTALWVTRYPQLVMSLVVAGIGSAVSEPASNLAIASTVAPGRQGMSFGWKQSAVPLGGVVAGFSIPAVTLNFGWRVSLALSALVPIVALVAVARMPRPLTRQVRRPGRVVTTELLLLAAIVGFGMAAVTSLQTFFVESAVSGGLTAGQAGTMLGVGGALGIAGRLLFGWRADRVARSSLTTLATLMGVGAVGYALLSAPAMPFMLFGGLLAFFAGWGWTGIFHLSVVRAYPSSPAAATGITSVGGRIGGMVGPTIFGVVANRAGFGPAWLLTAGLLALAMTTALTTDRLTSRPDLS